MGRTLLVIKSSITGTASKSNELVEQFVKLWQKRNAGGRVVTRDLASENLPHLTPAEMAAWAVDPQKRTEKDRRLARTSDALIAELKSADDIVIGMPMYNLTVPSTFQAYLDRLCRAGVTFKYGASGPVALVDAKKVFILCTRGGVYAGTPTDSQTPYLKMVLGFIGQTDLTFVYAEGLNMSVGEKAMVKAHDEISKIVPRTAEKGESCACSVQ